jgi:predicted PurR-regulated permease PerM
MKENSTAKKAFIFTSTAVLIIIIILLLKEVVQVLLLVFAAILTSVFLRGLAGLIKKVVKVKETPAILIAIAGLIVLVTVMILLLGPVISSGIQEVKQEAPDAIAQLKEKVSSYSWGKELIKNVEESVQQFSGNPEVRKRILGVFSSLLSIISGILVILVIGLYTAFSPGEYSHGFIKLFPENKRDRVNDILNKMEHALLWWMVGRFSSMAVVGILTSIGLMIMGVNFAVPLGILAALLSFIPNIGPILSAIPAAAMGLLESPQKAFYVLLLYVGVQTVESYLVTPQIQKRAVSISPALLLVVQLMIGVLLGIFGLILATPLMVVTIVLIQTTYVEDTLGDEVKVLGQ